MAYKKNHSIPACKSGDIREEKAIFTQCRETALAEMTLSLQERHRLAVYLFFSKQPHWISDSRLAIMLRTQFKINIPRRSIARLHLNWKRQQIQTLPLNQTYPQLVSLCKDKRSNRSKKGTRLSLHVQILLLYLMIGHENPCLATGGFFKSSFKPRTILRQFKRHRECPSIITAINNSLGFSADIHLPSEDAIARQTMFWRSENWEIANKPEFKQALLLIREAAMNEVKNKTSTVQIDGKYFCQVMDGNMYVRLWTLIALRCRTRKIIRVEFFTHKPTSLDANRFLCHCASNLCVNEVIQTDQGGEFADYPTVCQQLKICHHTNDAASPWQNGFIERLHRTLNNACQGYFSSVDLEPIADNTSTKALNIDVATRAIQSAVHEYEYRTHSVTGKTPADSEREFFNPAHRIKLPSTIFTKIYTRVVRNSQVRINGCLVCWDNSILENGATVRIGEVFHPDPLHIPEFRVIRDEHTQAPTIVTTKKEAL